MQRAIGQVRRHNNGMAQFQDRAQYAHQYRRGSGARRKCRRAVETYPYSRCGTLLSRGELAFYRVLRLAVAPWHQISLKVRLADVVRCPPDLWAQAPGRRLSQKHLDFVLYEKDTTRIIAAIELDDASHKRPSRRARDRFLDAAMRAANTPLVRVRAARHYDLAKLRNVISAAVRANRLQNFDEPQPHDRAGMD